MTTLKVTEYLPAYNYMEEVRFEYDFTNHRYKVNYGDWKPMTIEYELRIRKRYNMKVNWKWGNNMKELLQQIENEYSRLQDTNTELQRQCEQADKRYLEYKEHTKNIANRAYGVKVKVMQIEKILDNKFYESKDKVKIVRTLLEKMKEDLNKIRYINLNTWQVEYPMIQYRCKQ